MTKNTKPTDLEARTEVARTALEQAETKLATTPATESEAWFAARDARDIARAASEQADRELAAATAQREQAEADQAAERQRQADAATRADNERKADRDACNDRLRALAVRQLELEAALAAVKADALRAVSEQQTAAGAIGVVPVPSGYEKAHMVMVLAEREGMADPSALLARVWSSLYGSASFERPTTMQASEFPPCDRLLAIFDGTYQARSGEITRRAEERMREAEKARQAIRDQIAQVDRELTGRSLDHDEEKALKKRREDLLEQLVPRARDAQKQTRPSVADLGASYGQRGAL